MKKKLIALNTTIMLGLGSVFALPNVHAESISDMKQKQQDIQDKRAGVQSGIHNAEKKINQLQDKQETVDQQLSRLEAAIDDSVKKIDEKNNQIASTKADIEKLKKEIAVLKERIKQRNEVLKQRAVSFQESGGDVSYLEVILGSSSFSDFVGRVNAVATIVDADQEILKQNEQDKKDLEDKQKSVEKKLADLEGMLADLKNMQSNLIVQKKQKTVLMAQLKKKERDTDEERMGLKEESETLAAQESAIKKAIELEKTRQAELAAARKRAAEEAAKRAAEAKKAAAAAAASHHAKRSSTSHSSSPAPAPAPAPSESEHHDAPAVSSGMFTRPSAGVVTSQLGSRWNKFHAGIDIAAPGTNPVVAAADGVVIRSYLSSTYGNCVMISHSINGQLYTTVYAHLRSRNVSNGQVVAKGQQVGIMGNTGHSTGQHLHFELHIGPWNVAKTNAVNPLNYLNM
ncbi:peptidoglycan DD-metalloendopeptidase family protein [Bacillus sp. MUM 13]|uniref:murein hydrolase activator EnvC family protein n=1 Tax=Bacillus sp. MUM 13 TaxID=1678001 RepID=UPI0008F5BFF7|nr:peptidoglycan DD-metalloendopeptidase family protein [Bacillus sp. MUM 13]OIK11401.1 peptidase M23 [Bacillus sp. MUM 13]